MAQHLQDERNTLVFPEFFVTTYLISDHDNDCELTVRGNGKLFYVRISSSGLQNSPNVLKKYLKYLEVLRSGEEQVDGVFDDEFYEWVIQLFTPLFEQLAPPSNSASGRVTLQDYLFPTYFVCALKALNDEIAPCRLETRKTGRMPPGVQLRQEIHDDLKTWTTIFHPVDVESSPFSSAYALRAGPKKVLVDDGKTPRFFKAFSAGAPFHAIAELQAYRRIAKADLASNVRVCRLHGVVQNENGLLMGMLLTHIEHATTLSMASWPDTPFSLKQLWVNQLSETLTQLHQAGLVWGDAKPGNVLIDVANDAWIVDFGGGYTEGWVEREKAGTIEGDLEGMANIAAWIMR
jgi:serine/threonine protein kinase